MSDLAQLLEGFKFFPYHEFLSFDPVYLKERFTQTVYQELEQKIPAIHLSESGTEALVLAPSNDWDSRHFGHNIVDLQLISCTEYTGPEGDKRRSELLARAVKELDATCDNAWTTAYMRVDSRDYAAIWAAEKIGFRMYAGNVTYGLKLPLTDLEGVIKDTATDNDLAALQQITSNAFGGNELTRTRYYADPHFERQKVEELYDFWLRNSIAGQLADLVLVTRNTQGKVNAYATLRWKRLADLKMAEIGLIAVDPAAQGQGLARKLLDSCAAVAADEGSDFLLLGTQLDNYAIQKAMIYHGFVPKYTKFVYHRWSKT